MNPNEYRKMWNLTQEDLARQAGISVRTLRDIETRATSIGSIKVDTAVRLARAMGITVDELIGEVFEVDEKLIYEKDFKWFGGGE